MDALREFFAMGGYASYVWGSYGIFTLVMVVNIVVPLRRARRMREQLERELRFSEPAR